MAIDVCSEIAGPGISPRISFSYDLKGQTTDVPQRLEKDSDLHFCFNNSNTKFFQEISHADQLFSNGQILPIEPDKCRPTLPVFYDHTRLKSRLLNLPSEPPMDMGKADAPRLRRAKSNEQATSEKKLLKEFLTMGLDQVEEKPINGSKSFWKFMRSNSLNSYTCTKSKKGLIKSLEFLSRSNSTGSAPNPPKPSNFPHNLHRQASVSSCSRRSSLRSSSISRPGLFYPYPVLKKCGSYGNGVSSVRVSPVLNIPPPCISRGTVKLFVSLFCSGKDKKKKK